MNNYSVTSGRSSSRVKDSMLPTKLTEDAEGLPPPLPPHSPKKSTATLEQTYHNSETRPARTLLCASPMKCSLALAADLKALLEAYGLHASSASFQEVSCNPSGFSNAQETINE